MTLPQRPLHSSGSKLSRSARTEILLKRRINTIRLSFRQKPAARIIAGCPRIAMRGRLPKPGMTDFGCLVSVLILGLMVSVLAGCGIKAPPVAPGEQPPVVYNLAHTMKSGTLTLAWDLADDSPAVRQYTLYQSKEPLADELCEGCPFVFQRILKITAGSQKNETLTIELEKGFRYGFKVTATTASGHEGPASRTVKLNYK